MTDPTDIDEARAARQVDDYHDAEYEAQLAADLLSVSQLLLRISERVRDGELPKMRCAMFAWVNTDGLVDYEVSDNLEPGGEVLLTAPIQQDAAARLLARNYDDDGYGTV